MNIWVRIAIQLIVIIGGFILVVWQFGPPPFLFYLVPLGLVLVVLFWRPHRP